MSPDSLPPAAGERTARIRQIVAKCRERLAAGKPLDDAQLLAKFPDLQPELASELNKLRLVEAARIQAAAPSNPASSGAAGSSDTPTTSLRGPGAAPSQTAASPPAPKPPIPLGTPVGEPPRIRYFGDYELLSEIARGGMGVVYKARQVSLNRVVAIKMILAGGLASPEDIRRFHAEAEAAANLEHPNIVPIYEVGERNGMHYFSMGFVQGQSLSQMIRENPLPPRKAAEYVQKVADAIAYAHSKGVLHRDIKPHNILIDEHDDPRVTDFGLAKRTDAQSELTHSGQILGTPSYMPPEQALGDHAAVGPHSDVYSLGATLYALLTGRPPFQGENPTATLVQVLSQEPVSPRTLIPKLDRDLETITLKTIEKVSARRYSSAIALRDDLDRFLTGHPILARPVGRIERSLRWCRRNPVVASLSAVLLLSLVVGTVVSSFFAVRSERKALAETQARKLADDNALKAKRAEKKAETEAERAFEYFYDSQLQLSALYSAGYQGDMLARCLDRTAPEFTGGKDLRCFEWHYWRRSLSALEYVRPLATSAVTHIAVSTDGSQLAAATASGEIHLLNEGDGVVKQSIEPRLGTIAGIRFENLSQKLLGIFHSGAALRWSLLHQNEAEKIPLEASINQIDNISFLPGSSLIGIARSYDWDAIDAETLAFVPNKTRQLFRKIVVISVDPVHTAPTPPARVAVSLDGKSVAYVRTSVSRENRKTNIRLWQVDDPQTAKADVEVGATVTAIAFRTKSPTLIAAHNDGSLCEYDLKINRLKEIVTPGSPIVGMVLTADDRFAAVASDDKRVRVIPLQDTQQREEYLGLVGAPTAIAIHPSGQFVYAGDATGRLYKWGRQASFVNNQTETRLSTSGYDNPVGHMSFSPEGDHAIVAYAVHAGDLERISLRNPGERQRLTAIHELLPDGGARAMMMRHGVVVYSPSGNSLLSSQGGGIFRWQRGAEHSAPRIDIANPISYDISDRHIAIGDRSGMVNVFANSERCEKLTQVRGFAGETGCTALSACGRYLAFSKSSGEVAVVDTSNWAETRALETKFKAVKCLKFSPHGYWLAASGMESGELILCNLRDGELRRLAVGLNLVITGIAFTSDDRRMATSTEDSLQVWNTQTGSALLALKIGPRTTTTSNSALPRKVVEIAFLASDRVLVVGISDGTVVTFDTRKS